MNQKELYIKYLEDALNHAKTGEPMKQWQLRYGTGGWINKQHLVRDNLEKMSAGCLSIRIKPEPLEWTTFVFNQNGYKCGVAGEHLPKEKLAETLGCDASNILAIHYHEIEPE